MNKSWLRVAFAIVCVSGGIVAISKAFAAGGTQLKGTVTKISDGDTIHFKEPGNKRYVPVRMLHLDAPEEHYVDANDRVVGQEPWGKLSHERLAKLIPLNSHLTMRSLGLDKYDRVLGVLYSEGRDVNLKMVRDGWAIPYVICSGPECDANYFERESIPSYFKACDEAREQKLGVFSATKPLKEEPYIFRIRVGQRPYDKLVGDFASKKLFAPADYKRVDVCRRVFFMTEADARRAGFGR